MERHPLRTTAGLVFAAILGVTFLAIGLSLVMSLHVPPQEPGRSAVYLHMFGVRDAFLGGFALLLVAARQGRALVLFFASTTILPLGKV